MAGKWKIPLSAAQTAALNYALRGEEKEFFKEKMAEMRERFSSMPKTYEQDGKGDGAIAYLHYFAPSADWYITEKDMGDEQIQAFGLARIYETEMGYINLEELAAAGAELDLYFEPQTIGEIKNMIMRRMGFEEEDSRNRDVTAQSERDELSAELGRKLTDYELTRYAEKLGVPVKNLSGWTKAHEAAGNNSLPPGFSDWTLTSDNGWTVAHVAAKCGSLPIGFSNFDIRGRDGVTVAHVAAKFGYLTYDFNQWALKDNHGRSVEAVHRRRNSFYAENVRRYARESYPEHAGLLEDAKTPGKEPEKGYAVIHELASSGELPPQGLPMALWRYPGPRGMTTAHFAALRGKLHPDFDFAGFPWYDRDESGNTPAHYCAASGCLPESFRAGKFRYGWHVSNYKGDTVAHVAALNGHLPRDFGTFGYEWQIWNATGESVASVCARHAVEKDNAKELLMKRDFPWGVRNADGDTAAHATARAGILDGNFPHWEMTNEQGLSVAHTAAMLGHIPDNFPDDGFGICGDDHVTVAHMIVNSTACRGEMVKRAQAWLEGLKKATGLDDVSPPSLGSHFAGEAEEESSAALSM
jgi:hypothetical protein